MISGCLQCAGQHWLSSQTVHFSIQEDGLVMTGHMTSDALPFCIPVSPIC